MKRSRTVQLVLLFVVSAMAQKITIRPVDQVGVPIRGVRANINYFVTGDGWKSLTITDNTNSGRIEFDCISCGLQKWGPTRLIPPDTNAISPLTIFEDTLDISSNVNAPVDTTIELSIKWTLSPLASDSGRFLVPGILYQLLYDPPGDNSFASLKTGTARQTSMATTARTSLGAELTFGYEYKNELFGVGAEFEVSASVKYQRETKNEFTVTIAQNEEIQTASTDNEETVGPGKGDVVVAQSFWVKWQLGRSLRPGHPRAHTDGYIYKFFYAPVPNSGSVLKRVTMNQLQEEFKDHPKFIQDILAASAIDPTTGRIKPGLKGSPRLQHVEKTEISGDVPVSKEVSVTQTNALTISQEIDVGASVMAKVTAGGASAGAKLSMNFTVGSSQSTSTTYSRSFALSFNDNEPWDKVVMDVYIDRQFGVYVFDVDSSASLTSYPWEERYSGPSVRLTVSADTLTRSTRVSEIIPFTIRVLNQSSGTHSSLNSIGPVSATIIQSSGTTATIDPSSLSVQKGTPATFALSVASSAAGTFPIKVKVSDPRGGQLALLDFSARFDEVVDGIVLTAADSFYAVPFAIPDTVRKTFSLTVRNTSDQSRTIHIGFRDQRNGTLVDVPSSFSSVEAGGSRQFTATLTGIGRSLPYGATIWAELSGLPGTRKTVQLVMDTLRPKVVILYPQPGDTLKGGAADTIRWETRGNVPTLTWEYSVNGGQNWTKIATSPSSAGKVLFAIPPLTSGTVALRVAYDSSGTLVVKSVSNLSIVFGASSVISSPKKGVESIALSRSGSLYTLQLPSNMPNVVVTAYDLRGRVLFEARSMGRTELVLSPREMATGPVLLHVRDEALNKSKLFRVVSIR